MKDAMNDARAALLARMQAQRMHFNPLEDHADPDARPEKVAFVPASLWADITAYILDDA